MPAADFYDYAIVRVVPRVERGEFVNVGVILSCASLRSLQARFELDEPRLLALDAKVDLAAVKRHLASIDAICRGGPDSGPIGALPVRERFHWLTAPRSSIIQTSPVHTGRCTDVDAVIDRLLDRMVRAVSLCRDAAKGTGSDAQIGG